jgi:hypothetical protein
MAGTYKVWCDDEQKFVTGFKGPQSCTMSQQQYPYGIDVDSVFLVERLSTKEEDLPMQLRATSVHLTSPPCYAGAYSGQRACCRRDDSSGLKPGNGISNRNG